MNYICVIDSSLPPYAAPLTRECVATVLVPAPLSVVPESVTLALHGMGVLGVFVLIVLRIFRG